MRIALITRFWPKVDKSPPSGCWEWTGAVNSHGYGSIRGDGGAMSSMLGAHVASWLLHHGAMPPAGMCVLHRCDNRKCVRPDHLFLGTKGDNNRDRDAKGRTARGARSGRRLHPERWVAVPRGSAHGRSRLTEDQVIAIRAAYAAGGVTQEFLADRYGVTQGAIWMIVHRRSWKHLP